MIKDRFLTGKYRQDKEKVSWSTQTFYHPLLEGSDLKKNKKRYWPDVLKNNLDLLQITEKQLQ